MRRCRAAPRRLSHVTAQPARGRAADITWGESTALQARPRAGLIEQLKAWHSETIGWATESTFESVNL